MTPPSRLGRLEQGDDDAPYAEVYYDAGQATPPRDWSSRYDYSAASDIELARAERWVHYYVESGLKRSEIHRLRAIHQEQQRRFAQEETPPAVLDEVEHRLAALPADIEPTPDWREQILQSDPDDARDQ